MKKYSFLIAAGILLLSACNASVKHEDPNEETKAGTETPQATAPKTAKAVDPVCSMEKEDDSWTEFTVTGTDTTWFCSPHCKETFDKAPEKYLKKAEAQKG